MKKLKKLPFKTIAYMGVQCMYHHPAYLTAEHSGCMKKWKKEALATYRQSPEYKHIEILNAYIEELNNKK